MTDFTKIIPADLLPDAVLEYDRLFGDGTFGRAMASIPCDVGEEQIYVAHITDAAIAAALELAKSLMRQRNAAMVDRDRYRDLFKRANDLKRCYREDVNDWHSWCCEEAKDGSRWRKLFLKANAAKRKAIGNMRFTAAVSNALEHLLRRSIKKCDDLQAALDAERAKRCKTCKTWAEYTVNGKPLPRPDGWCSLQEFGTTADWVCGDWEAQDD